MKPAEQFILLADNLHGQTIEEFKKADARLCFGCCYQGARMGCSLSVQDSGGWSGWG